MEIWCMTWTFNEEIKGMELKRKTRTNKEVETGMFQSAKLIIATNIKRKKVIASALGQCFRCGFALSNERVLTRIH